jgi:hypothetical protein
LIFQMLPGFYTSDWNEGDQSYRFYTTLPVIRLPLPAS